MESKKVGRNNSIDIFRFISALLVLAIHTNPMMEINLYLGYICSQILPRVAVPFFFCVSGYFYIKKLEKISRRKEIMEVFKVTFLSYLKVYFLWTVVYGICDYDRYFYEGATVKGIIVGIVLNFCVYGGYYHLWYFIGIFFSLIIVTACYLIRIEKILACFSIILYLIGVLGCAYYGISSRIPLLSILVTNSHFTLIRRIILMGLPFFMLGYFLPKISKQKITWKLVLSGVCFIGEIVIVNIFQLSANIVETLFLYVFLAYLMIWLSQHSMPEKKQIGKSCHYVANFIYFSHPLFILIIKWLGVSGNTAVFLLAALFSIVIGFILMKFNNKIVNQFIG